MKDLWPSASRFWHLIKPGLKRSKTQFLTRFDPKTLLKEAGLINEQIVVGHLAGRGAETGT